MQDIQTKQAEAKWSLPQHRFLVGSRKTGSLTYLSEDWIQSQMQSSLWLALVVQSVVRIFSSRTDLPKSFSFFLSFSFIHSFFLSFFLSILPAESQKLYFWPPVLSYIKMICFDFTAWPHCSHCVGNGGFEVSIQIVGQTITPSFAASVTVHVYIWTQSRMTFDVEWPVRKIQVAYSDRCWLHEL